MQTDSPLSPILARVRHGELQAGQRIWIRKTSHRGRGWFSAEVLRGAGDRELYPLARFDEPGMGWTRRTGDDLAEQFGASTSFWNLGGSDCDVALMTEEEEREVLMAITRAPVDPETLPVVSATASNSLEPGTRLLVHRLGGWRGAVVVENPSAMSTRMLMKFDEAGRGYGWNGHHRHPGVLEDEDTYYYHDHTVIVVVDPNASPPEGEDVTRIELPETPQWVESWEPPTRPRRVEGRWIMTRIANHLFHILYMGDCLSCGYGTYSTPDGNVPASVGGRTLVVIKDGEKRIRMCYNCARSSTGLERGLENAKDREDTAPIAWPEDKMDLRLLHPTSAKRGADVLDVEDEDPF